MIGEHTIEGVRALTLASERSEVEAAFAVCAGMVGCSLRHRGVELLGRRGGLGSYIEHGSTMGIPLLAPWANRLSSRRFALAGREVILDPELVRYSTDQNGLPMHGLLAAAEGWVVRRHEAGVDGGVLLAEFDFAARSDLMGAFPFPHMLTIEAALAGSELRIATTVRATGGVQVPVCFGFHPYLCIPGVPRAEWEVEIPVAQRLGLDRRMLPTGAREPVGIEPGPLGSRTFDDAYLAPPSGEPFVLRGGGRRVELRMLSGYRFAQVYAPGDDEVIAYEPMTAPTNALISGGPDLTLVAPGESFTASFSITVVDGP